jgi:hypothetical protein
MAPGSSCNLLPRAIAAPFRRCSASAGVPRSPAGSVLEMAQTNVMGMLYVVALPEHYAERTSDWTRETLGRYARASRTSSCLHKHLQASGHVPLLTPPCHWTPQSKDILSMHASIVEQLSFFFFFTCRSC